MSSLFDLINIPFAYVIRFLDSVTHNYLLTLLLFAIVIKIVLFPFGIKQQKNMVKQASLRPKEQLIRAKYAGRNDRVTQQKVNEEVMALYQKEGYSPTSGCLPMILQLIIVWAVYQIVYNPLTYIMRLGKENITAIRTYLDVAQNAREIDMISKLRDIDIASIPGVSITDGMTTELPNFHLWGSFGDLSITPSEQIWWYILIPVFVLLSTFLSMKLTRKFSYQPPTQGTDDMSKSMKIMDITMPLFSTFIAFTLPAAIGVYWIFQSVLGVLQQFILSKMLPIPVYTEEQLKAFQKEYGATSNRQRKKQEKAKVRSLHHIDDDDDEDAPAPVSAPKKANTPKAGKTDNKETADSVIAQAPLQDESDKD